MPDVVTLGETMAVLAPAFPTRLRNSRTLTLGVGGAETNVAVSLARLGVSTGWVSRLGDDELGDLVLSTIRGEGVDCSQVSRSDAPTGVYFRDVTSKDSVRAFYYRHGSAASTMGPGDLDDEYFNGARILHVTGITLALSESCAALVREAIGMARQRGVRISFDVNFRAKLWNAEQARAAIDELLPDIDMLFVGNDEAELIWNGSDESVMRGLAARGPAEVIMKRGSKGARTLHRDNLFEADGMSVQVVDSVGAGDAFAAGYLAATTWGMDVDERLTYGNAMGAHSVSNRGDFENAPSLTELEVFLGKRLHHGR